MHHSCTDRLTTVCKYTLVTDIWCNIYKEIFKVNISSTEKNTWKKTKKPSVDMCSNAINCSTIVSETLMGCCIIHSARLALAVRLNSPQHGTVLFVISWSLHNQSHSGQLLISLETWGWLCSNSNDNSCRFSNPPPKLCRWHRGTLIYGQINNRSGHSCIRPSQGSLIFFIAIFNLWVSFRARCVQGSLFPARFQLTMPSENRSQ